MASKKYASNSSGKQMLPVETKFPKNLMYFPHWQVMGKVSVEPWTAEPA